MISHDILSCSGLEENPRAFWWVVVGTVASTTAIVGMLVFVVRIWPRVMDRRRAQVSPQFYTLAVLINLIWSIELFLKSLKNSYSGLWCLRSFQVLSEPPILVKWKGDVWLRPRNGYMKMNSLSNFWHHHFKFLEKFAMKFILCSCFWAKHLPFISPNWGFNTTWCSLNIINCQKGGETPYQNMRF